jgi:hypothetical protein
VSKGKNNKIKRTKLKDKQKINFKFQSINIFIFRFDERNAHFILSASLKLEQRNVI